MEKNIKNQNEQQSDRISTENIVNKPIAIDELNMSSKVTPGDIVPGGFTYPNNAIVQNDFLYLRDANGNQIAGRTVNIGDKITVLKIHHDKQLALVQYPAGSVVREGYVTNSTKVIKYLNEYNWVNDSSAEPVYETESSSDGKWGTLSAYEKATKLYKSNNRICVAYDTSKGAHTKSGFVEYEGGSNNSGSNNTNNINPGDIVPGGFTYPNNAVIENDFLYLRDANGNQIAGRTVSVGDKITVLDVGYAKQLALIQYPTSSGVRQGYVTNATNIIRYLDEYNYYNGSTSETVYANSTGSATLGSLNPYECATKLYSKDGRIHIVYDTDKGGHTKSGYVNFAGLDVPVTNITIPDISDPDVTKIEYGKSGKGRPLNVYKIGNGKKALFAGFALHGFEDHWFRDGEALVKIATDLIYKLANYKRTNGDLHGYTVYVAQCMNPDGVIEGRSQNGPGRCAVVSRVDMNRCFPYKFSVNTNSRYYTGSSPLGAIEAVKLRDLILKIRSESTETYVLDFHGWLGFTQGNYDAAKYIANQFGFTHNYTDAGGFFSSWANSLGSDIKGALIEYPKSTANYQSVLNGNYAGKTFNGIINLIKNNAGAGNSNTGNEDQAYNATGKVINVTSTLNVRNQPSTSATVVGTLKGDQTVTITAKNGSWYKISSPLVGYVHSDYISITNTSNGDQAYNATGKVINVTSTLNVRNQPSTSGTVVGTLTGNQSVTITAKNGSWYKISSPLVGYVHSDYISITNTSNGDQAFNTTGKVINVTSTLNVRNQPSTSGAVVGTLKSDQTVTITAKNGSWYKISSPLVGYVHSDYISIINNGENNNYPKTPMDTVIENLDKLAELTVDYCKQINIEPTKNTINKYILDYLRQFKYADVEWTAIVGTINQKHIEYINNTDSRISAELNSFIINKNQDISFKDYNIDLPHLAATTLGYYYATIVPSFWTGWGGDLATAIAEVIDLRFTNDDLQQIADDIIGSEKHSFSEEDIIADIDAIELADKLKDSTFNNVFKNYYNTVTKQKRKDIFINKGTYYSNGNTLESLSENIKKSMIGIHGFDHPAGMALRKKAGNLIMPPPLDITQACSLSLAKYIFNNLK